MLLGVKAVIAESFERIHRSNLVNMGVLPLQFLDGESAASHGLTGREVYELVGGGPSLTARGMVTVNAKAEDGSVKTLKAKVRIDTPEELVAYRHGGILPYVLRQLASRTGTVRSVRCVASCQGAACPSRTAPGTGRPHRHRHRAP